MIIRIITFEILEMFYNYIVEYSSITKYDIISDECSPKYVIYNN